MSIYNSLLKINPCPDANPNKSLEEALRCSCWRLRKHTLHTIVDHSTIYEIHSFLSFQIVIRLPYPLCKHSSLATHPHNIPAKTHIRSHIRNTIPSNISQTHKYSLSICDFIYFSIGKSLRMQTVIEVTAHYNTKSRIDPTISTAYTAITHQLLFHHN